MIKHCRITLALTIGALGLLTVNTPAQNRELTSEKTGHRYVFYIPGNEPAVAARDLSNLRLAHSPCADRTSVMDYTMQIGIYEDSDTKKAVHEGPRWSGQTERGVTTYIPRVTLTARNKTIDIGMIMVIEYFSQDVADKHNITRECVEHIPLALTQKGQSIVFDGAGAPLFKVEHQADNLAGRTATSRQGKDFYGLIASLFNNNMLVFQQYAPASLLKSCAPNIPAVQTPDKRRPEQSPHPRRPWRQEQ